LLVPELNGYSPVPDSSASHGLKVIGFQTRDGADGEANFVVLEPAFQNPASFSAKDQNDLDSGDGKSKTGQEGNRQAPQMIIGVAPGESRKPGQLRFFLSIKEVCFQGKFLRKGKTKSHPHAAGWTRRLPGRRRRIRRGDGETGKLEAPEQANLYDRKGMDKRINKDEAGDQEGGSFHGFSPCLLIARRVSPFF
jgi:hypothetical protein